MNAIETSITIGNITASVRFLTRVFSGFKGTFLAHYYDGLNKANAVRVAIQDIHPEVLEFLATRRQPIPTLLGAAGLLRPETGLHCGVGIATEAVNDPWLWAVLGEPEGLAALANKWCPDAPIVEWDRRLIDSLAAIVQVEWLRFVMSCDSLEDFVARAGACDDPEAKPLDYLETLIAMAPSAALHGGRDFTSRNKTYLAPVETPPAEATADS